MSKAIIHITSELLFRLPRSVPFVLTLGQWDKLTCLPTDVAASILLFSALLVLPPFPLVHSLCLYCLPLPVAFWLCATSFRHFLHFWLFVPCSPSVHESTHCFQQDGQLPVLLFLCWFDSFISFLTCRVFYCIAMYFPHIYISPTFSVLSFRKNPVCSQRFSVACVRYVSYFCERHVGLILQIGYRFCNDWIVHGAAV